MNIEKVPRRERRHFRKYINGEIVYSDVPFGHEEKHNYSSKDVSKEQDVRSLLDVDKKNKPIVHKDEKIQKVLRNISDIVAPDIDSIADAIYFQISKDEGVNNFKKEEIQETIKSSKHYRASTNDSGELVETENMKSLVEDVFDQLENEEIRKDSKTSKEDKKVLKENKKTETKKVVKEEKKINSKKKETSEIQDLLDEDSEDLNLDDDDDDLGLKF